VLTTLHAQTAAAAVQRLLDIGVDPGLISTAVNCFVGQRLVRRLCPSCSEPFTPTAAELAALGLGGRRRLKLHHAVGCPECGGTGYRGRVGLFGVLAMTDEVGALVGAPTRELQAAAVAQGMTTLHEDGLRLCREGITSVSELRRVAGDRVVHDSQRPAVERRTRTRRTTARRAADRMT
jgi:type II secretory ATPase GspE/PulE/Tfp pilus assembly ATPase PilB-like protein